MIEKNFNKYHWYDGWFYDTFIAPNQDKLFGQIKNLIEPNSKVIDIGCGTGRFSFIAADKCESVLGIDLSKRNIDRANFNLFYQTEKLKKTSLKNISFRHNSIKDLITENKYHFNYAVLTYVIHEVNENERVHLLNDVKEIADKIIIGDYLIPRPTGLWNIINELVEFAAGKEHYNNFKSFVNNDGIKGLVKLSGLKIIYETENIPSTSHLLILSK